MPTVNDVPAAQDFATDFVNQLNVLSGCWVAAAEVTFPLTVTPQTADPGYRNDAGATLSIYNNASPVPRAYSMYVPGFLLTKITNGIVEANDANMVTFRDAILTSGFGTGGNFLGDENYLQIGPYRIGKQSVRR